MYSTIFKPDPLDPARGQKYREKILLPGGSQDDLESLKVSVREPLFLVPCSEEVLLLLFYPSRAFLVMQSRSWIREELTVLLFG